jgi:transposase InsO family protein
VTTYRFIEAEKANHTVRMICRVLRVSRAAYYAWRDAQEVVGVDADARLRVHVRGLHRASRGTYGSPRMTAALRKQGVVVNHKRVARIMREEGLQGAPRRRFRGSTTDSAHARPVAPNVLARDFSVTAPNVAWVGDITYLPVGGGWAYLAVLIDLYSRKVVGWALDEHMRTELCLAALDRAVAVRRPPVGLVHHSDRGSQYASAEYVEALQRVGIVQSMSRKGNCWDNAVAESFFGTLEQELGGRARWTSVTVARAEVGRWIHAFYNDTRLHSTIGFHSPVEYEALHRASITEAA